MTSSFPLTINTRFVLETRTGGRCRYQVEALGPLELLLTVFLFLVSVAVSVVKIEADARPVACLPIPRPIATRRAVAGVWARQYFRGVSGR
jgi:hypothetical protein